MPAGETLNALRQPYPTAGTQPDQDEKSVHSEVPARPGGTLSLSEAAAMLVMSAGTLRKKAAAGKVPGYKAAKAWVFFIDDLREFLKASKPWPSIAAPAPHTGGSDLPSTDAKSASALTRQIAAKRRSLKRMRAAKPGVKPS